MSTALEPLFTKGIEKHIIQEMKTWKPAWRNIFHVETTDKRYVDAQIWQAYSLPTFRVPGQAVKQDQIAPSFAKRYIMRSFGLGDSFAYEDIDDDLYGLIHRIIPKSGGAMARAFEDLMEIQTANYFAVNGYVAGTSVAGMVDGVSLFNTAHPISLANSATTVANRPSTEIDLSIAGAQAAATNLRTQLRPNNTTYIHNEVACVVVNPALLYVAKQVYRGQWERATADRNTNYLTDDNVDIIPWPYFKKSGSTGTNNAWFVIGREHYLRFIMRSAYRVDTQGDANTKSQIVTTDARFDYGADDWRGTWGTTGI